MTRTFLQAHSEFSLLAGVPTLPDLVAHAKESGYTSLALADVNRMSGLILFHQECVNQGIQPILGVDLREAMDEKIAVTLLAKNDEGYGDLCEIITLRQMNGAGFSIGETFQKPWPNLILLSNSLKSLAILSKGPNRERLYGSLIRHSPEARIQSREVEAFCDREKIPATAVGDAWFLRPGDWEIHRILRAIDLNSTPSRLRPGETSPEGAWLLSPADMDALFDTRPEAVATAEKLAAQCRVKPPMGKWIMPEIEVEKGYTPDTWLRKLACEGLRENYGGGPDFNRAEEIQEMELGVIQKLGYASYFLMVKDVYKEAGRRFEQKFRTAKDCSLLRGSAANSLTFYNLGIGRLDPIEHDLYFQRFLNEDRASPPDADLDFGWDEREQILEHMVKHFGRERVAITCTFNHFKFKSAFREVAKVFGYSEEQTSEVLNAYNSNSRRREDAEIRMLHQWAAKIEGKPHFLGQHPGGLLITNQPVWRHVACEWSGGGGGDPAGLPHPRLITQIDMRSGIDELGLIKFDLLGNGSLSVLRDTLQQISDQGLPDPEVWDLKKCQDDPEVWDLLAEGRARGIFYLESPAQMRLNIKADARRFDEIVVTSSLIRPAGTPYARTYVERHRKSKLGIKDWEFLHPSLEPILHETHDVIAFQEDVTKICHEVAGLTFKQSDDVRRQMNSQHDGALPSERLKELFQEFVEGCETNPKLSHPLTRAQAIELWERIASFTGFSFCKSHSASYAQLSFQCAWLKVHRPAPFLAAVISNNHGFYKREVYLNEARRVGLQMLPLHINHSEIKFIGQGNSIRPGFLHLRQISDRTLNYLVEERDKNGLFRDLEDFLRRVPAGRREMENLILAGAWDDFGLTQPELLFHLDGIYHGVGSASPFLFDGEKGYRPRDLHPGLQNYSLMQRCQNETRLLGYMLSGNPLDILELHPAAKGAVAAIDLGRYLGKRVKIFGSFVTDRLHRVIRSKRLMMFLTLEDQTGCLDVIFWPDTLDKFEDALLNPGPFEVWGKVTEDWDTYSLEAEKIRPVSFAPNVVDFELASSRLRAGMQMEPHSGLKAARVA